MDLEEKPEPSPKPCMDQKEEEKPKSTLLESEDSTEGQPTKDQKLKSIPPEFEDSSGGQVIKEEKAESSPKSHVDSEEKLLHPESSPAVTKSEEAPPSPLLVQSGTDGSEIVDHLNIPEITEDLEYLKESELMIREFHLKKFLSLHESYPCIEFFGKLPDLFDTVKEKLIPCLKEKFQDWRLHLLRFCKYGDVLFEAEVRLRQKRQDRFEEDYPKF